MKFAHMYRRAALVLAGAVLPWAPLSAKSDSTADAREPSPRICFRAIASNAMARTEKSKGRLICRYSSGGDLEDDPELLQAVLDAIDFGEMPPEDEKQIPLELRDSALSHLQALLNESVGKDPAFATTRIRRMNRFQYANAVEDLLKLKVSVFPLPEKMMRDRSGYFNRAIKDGMPDSLTVSSRPLGKSGLIEPRLSGVGPFLRICGLSMGTTTKLITFLFLPF